MAAEGNNKSDPGASQFGNFINYYEFNPASNRLKLFRENFAIKTESAEPVICLDIGCNTGELTQGVYEVLSSSGQSVHMLGVDLDAVLVERANEKLIHLRERRPAIQFQAVDVMNVAERQRIWRQYLDQFNGPPSRFDFIFCFSTTMWIHLNHGDQGLEDFLTAICQWSDNVIIEPQPWKCYRNAVRRLKRADKTGSVSPLLFPAYHAGLRYRTNISGDICQIMCNKLGMLLHSHLGQSTWDRPVIWFKRPVSS